MCTMAFNLNAMYEKCVNLVPIHVSNGKYNKLPERHKKPAKQMIRVFCEGDEVFVQNAPVGGQISFYGAQGNLLVQDVFHASEYAIEIPALAVSIEISYGDVTLRGDLEENN